MKKEDFIEDWEKTIGLTVDSIEEYFCNWFDDPVTFIIIRFTNGKFVVQRDQGYYTTITGIVPRSDFEETMLLIKKAAIEENEKQQ